MSSKFYVFNGAQYEPIEMAAGSYARPIMIDDWSNSSPFTITISAAEHGLVSPPFSITIFREIEGEYVEYYDSPKVNKETGEITLVSEDGKWNGFVIVSKGGGYKGEKGDPQSLDKFGTVSKTDTIINLSFADSAAAVFGKQTDPIIIDGSVSAIDFTGLLLKEGTQRSFVLYLMATEAYSIIWEKMIKIDGKSPWAYGETPTLPIGRVRKVLIEVYEDGGDYRYFGTAGDYFGVPVPEE